MEWNLKTIVVGVDGSDGSKRAGERAVAIARHWDAKLLLVTVIRPPEGWWGIGGAPPSAEALSTALVEGQQRILSEMEEHLDLEGIDYETVEELGDPTSSLISVAERREADAIVSGRRGAGIAERVLMGSVSDRIVHHADIPVLVVP
jgi:nucleotide-binding universal stress UspA family protein